MSRTLLAAGLALAAALLAPSLSWGAEPTTASPAPADASSARPR